MDFRTGVLPIPSESETTLMTNKLFDYSSFPTLSTTRLILRQVRLTDAADVLIFRGDPYVQHFNGPVFESVGEAEDLIRELHQEFVAERGLGWAVSLKQSGRVIGLFSFHGWNRYHRRADVGYDMARDCWGQGYASEALGTMLGFGFGADGSEPGGSPDHRRQSRIGAPAEAIGFSTAKVLVAATPGRTTVLFMPAPSTDCCAMNSTTRQSIKRS